jgi:hypothetical protein
MGPIVAIVEQQRLIVVMLTFQYAFKRGNVIGIVSCALYSYSKFQTWTKLVWPWCKTCLPASPNHIAQSQIIAESPAPHSTMALAADSHRSQGSSPIVISQGAFCDFYVSRNWFGLTLMLR